MVVLDLLSLSTLTGWFLSRNLQEIPDYTSPALDIAIAATPKPFRNDTYLDLIRQVAGNGECSNDVTNCQILFPPPPQTVDGTAKIGVIFYGGGLVDPRAYSVMAKALSERYGFAVSIPIFSNDIAYLGCNGTNRIPLATKAFPEVEKWVLAGHSMGGIGAQVDLWNALSTQKADKIGGMVLIASYISSGRICDVIDFSSTNIPMAGVSASLDYIINKTNYEFGKQFFPVNDTLFVDIIGGNHGYFGYYNYSLRTPILGQNDGNATISRDVQHNLTIAAIVNVAERMGLPLPLLSTSRPEGEISSAYMYLPGIIFSSITILITTIFFF